MTNHGLPSNGRGSVDPDLATESAPQTESEAPHRIQQIGMNAGRVVEDSRSLLTDGLTAVADRMRRHPYQTMLLAAGVGYVLGGGLFTALTARMVRTGLRVAALPLVQTELVNAAQAFTRAGSSG